MYTFRYASEAWEFEQIHRLNYQAFVEELPQHPANPERRLIDKFHAQNTYAIGLADDQIVAMLALRNQRPFSLDAKLENLDSYLPPNRSLCEIRLLYVASAHRRGKALQGLFALVAAYGVTHAHDLALISGTTRQQRFYRHIGFVPFGPLVGTREALFQPMYLTMTTAKRYTWAFAGGEDPVLDDGAES
ncbi:MAG: GNAT family N-acyltransferase [Caldilineaceae bacterium]